MGQSATLDDVVEAMGGVDVVFVGEEHDDSIGHVVEDQLLQKAYARWASTGEGSPHAGAGALKRAANPRVLAVSMEMFETDIQLVLNEYLEGLITEDQFQAASRPWPTTTPPTGPWWSSPGRTACPWWPPTPRAAT